MAEQYPQPVFLDATVLSNFASSDAVGVLAELLEAPVVVPAVRDEIERGHSAGHGYLASAIEAFDDGLMQGEAPSESGSTGIHDGLDAGEADSLLAAVEHDGTLATDDLAARRAAEERSIPVTGSIGLLVLCVERGHLDIETADAWLATWRHERGYYAPVKGLSDVLEERSE